MTIITGDLAPTISPKNVVGTMTLDPTGFVNKDDVSLSFDDGSLTVTVTATGASWDMYKLGEKITRTGPDEVIIDDTHGLWFIYYVDSTLTASQTPWSFDGGDIFVCIVYWDTANTKYFLGDERHGLSMDWATHGYLHSTVGTALARGGALTDLITDSVGDANGHAQFGIEETQLRDEDIPLVLTEKLYTDNVVALYRSGVDASNIWYIDDSASYGVLTAGTGRAAWNELTGGSWQLTEVTDGMFVLAHVLALNDLTKKYGVILGQNEYATLDDARSGAKTEVNNLVLSGMPATEFKFLGTIIYQTDDDYSNAVQSRTRSVGSGNDYVDLRVDINDSENWNIAYTHSQSTSGNPHSVTTTELSLENVANVDTTDADNISDGSTNAIPTLVQETAWDAAYTHTSTYKKIYETDEGTPGANNDGVDSAGLGITFFRGDIWCDTDNDQLFWCAYNTTGAAQWFEIVALNVQDTITNKNYEVRDNGHLGTGKIDGDLAYISAYDVDGAAYQNFITLTAANTPTCVIDTAVTQTEWDAAYTHSGVTTGNPHSVTTTELSLENVANVDTTDADNISDGSTNAIITLTQETNFEAAYTHVSNNGTDHSYIDQDVTSGTAPTFTADNFSDGGSNAIITTTQETNFQAGYDHSQATHHFDTPEYGSISIVSNTTAETGITTPGTFYVIVAFDTDGISSTNVTPDSTTDNDITVDVTGTYEISWDLSFEGSNDESYNIKVHNGGTPIEETEAQRDITATTTVGCASGSTIAALTANDTLDLRITSSAASDTAIICRHGNLTVKRIA